MTWQSLAFIAMTVLAVSVAACDRSSVQADAADPCTPVETRRPNVPEQHPAFEGQTRACEEKLNVAFDVAVLADNLVHPWAVEPLPDGALLVTERPGRMRVISAAGDVGDPLEGLPRVDARNQGGLMDVALSPSFAADRTIFWSYTEPRGGGNGTSVARGVVFDAGARIDDVRVIFRAMPTYDGDMHFGSRLAFDRDGHLFVTLGERSDRRMREHAQRRDTHLGTIVRINTDGSPPDDNPFAGQADAQPEVWTLGHRNVQAAAFDEDGRFWVVEHGAQGGDELILIEKGNNYGWPLVAYGEEYSGAPIPNAVTQREGYEQPVYYWDPVIAPSGAQFYTADAIPEWRGSLFVGNLKDGRLVRLTIEGERVLGEEHLLGDRNQRIRDVRQGPDGALYIVTDEDPGELWKITARR